MNHPSPTSSSLRHDADAKLPAAAYLRYETRADGWSPGRQAAFLAHLADNGVVEEAARSVGMSVGGGYALRRTARGYAFNLGWEAALIIARRIVADQLMTAAIRGEEARWVREEGITTYTRQNSKLALTLLDRINPATTVSEVMAVATRFDWFLQLVDEGAGAEELWALFFDDALPTSDIEARARVRQSLLLCAESAGFEETDDEDGDNEDGEDAPVEYKSMDGPQKGHSLSGEALRVANSPLAWSKDMEAWLRSCIGGVGEGACAQPLTPSVRTELVEVRNTRRQLGTCFDRLSTNGFVVGTPNQGDASPLGEMPALDQCCDNPGCRFSACRLRSCLVARPAATWWC